MELNARNGNTCWPHFPAVLARVEVYSETFPGRPLFTEHSYFYELQLDGRRMEFADYTAAQNVASMLADPRYYGARQDWRERIGCEADFLALADEWLADVQLEAA